MEVYGTDLEFPHEKMDLVLDDRTVIKQSLVDGSHVYMMQIVCMLALH